MANLIPSDLAALWERLERRLVATGLSPVRVQKGRSYKHKGSTICRIDPKPTRCYLRVEVGKAAEQAAPPELRGHYRQEGWLVVRLEHEEVAGRYLEQFARRRLHDLRSE